MINLEFPKLELLLSIMCKLTPCCRNEGIFVLTPFSKQFLLTVVYLFDYVFGEKVLVEYWYVTSSYLNNPFLFSIGSRSVNSRRDAIAKKMCFAKVCLVLWHQQNPLGHCELFCATLCNGVIYLDASYMMSL